jgi:hypothetical protein
MRRATLAILIAVALNAATFASCGSDDDGVPVPLAAAVVLDAGTITFAGAQAGTITGGHVTVTSVELLPCVTVERWLEPTRAHAHGGGAPGRSEEPFLLALVGGTPLVLDPIPTPEASYCFVDLTIGPPDDDAVGLPASGEGVGESIALKLHVGGNVIDVVSTGSTTHRIELAAPLVVEDGGAPPTIQVSFDAGAWLTGQDPATIETTPNTLLTSASAGLALTLIP